jgi:hypothetical protein
MATKGVSQHAPWRSLSIAVAQKEICWDPVIKGQGSSCEG